MSKTIICTRIAAVCCSLFRAELRHQSVHLRFAGLVQCAALEKMKELRLCETEVSLRGALNQTSEAQMDALVAELCAE